MTLLMTTGSLTIAAGAVIFLVITLILVGALLAAKAKLVPSGNVDLKVNGEQDIEKSCRQKRAFSLVNRLRNTGVWHVSAK